MTYWLKGKDINASADKVMLSGISQDLLYMEGNVSVGGSAAATRGYKPLLAANGIEDTGRAQATRAAVTKRDLSQLNHTSEEPPEL